MNRPVAYLETSFVSSSNEILDEVYVAREKLRQRGGGTMQGVCEYLRECGRRAKERGGLWIESAEERDAIGAEVRARLARDAAEGEWKDATSVGEERERYGVADGAATGGTPMGGQRPNVPTTKRSNDPTILRSNDPTIQRFYDPTMQRSNDPNP